MGADPEMSTLWGNVVRRLWPIAPGHHSDASSSTDPYDEEEEEREPLMSVSLEGIQLKGIVQTTDKRIKQLSAIEIGGDFTDPLLLLFFFCL